jgi:ADP-heptose:LPS heptosyltransferase
VLFGRKTVFTKKNTLLILRLDSIGDYILFRNFIQVIKESGKYKNYKITLCGNSWWKDLSESLEANYIDEFIWVDYVKMNDVNYRFRIFNQVHSRGFELLIHPTYSRDVISDSVVKNSGAKSKIGYDGDLVNLTADQKKKNDPAYSYLVPSESEFKFEFYRNRFFFEHILPDHIDLKKPQIKWSLVKENKIIVFPGAKDAFRRWSPLNFAALCDTLKTDFPDDEFVICGSEQDDIFANAIIENSKNKFLNYTGKLTLTELLDMLSQAKLIITNDSGPFHIAVALNKKVLCISNGNNYGRFTPYPKEMNTSGAVIFPAELLRINSESERLDQFCRHGSLLDINSIEVSVVHDMIKKYFEQEK